MGLFEQGILDRGAIEFLFQLGFVPASTADSRGLLTSPNVTPSNATDYMGGRERRKGKEKNGKLSVVTTVDKDSSAIFVDDHDDHQIEVSITATTTTTTKHTTENMGELAITTSPTSNVLHNTNSAVPGVTTLHSQQTLRSLEATAIRRKLSQHDSFHHSANKKMNGTQKNKTKNGGNEPFLENNNDVPKPWNVEHFPLSLSRYEREFKEICLLNSGSFGSVYRAIREIDGIEYAVKKITFDAVGYSSENIERVIREVQCLAAVNDHPNIVRYFTSWWEPTWMTGSIPANTTETGTTNSRHRNAIDNYNDSSAADSTFQSSRGSRSRSTQKELKKQLLQIEAPSIDDLISRRNDEILKGVQKRIDEVSLSSSSSSSSSWSSDSDEDEFYDRSKNYVDESSFFSGVGKIGPRRGKYSLDEGVRAIQEETWETYHSHKLEPWGEVYDDSYTTQTASRRRQRSARKAKKNVPTPAPYQYQISLYIQMQLCHPATLQDWIRERNKQIPEGNHEERIAPALEIFQQLCSGLEHIHKSNVIHRDLKPANIFVSSDGNVIKIGDFGLSKQLHDIVNQQRKNKSSRPTSPQSPQSPPGEDYWQTSKSPINSDSIVPLHAKGPSAVQALAHYNKVGINLTAGVGTASYAAPEQVQSKNYGTAVDIFSLGLIFLELVSCFETEHERLHNLQQCRYQRVPKWLDENYPEIASTILACTRPNASDRPTANDLLNSARMKSPRIHKEVLTLKRELIEKNKEIAEKDEAIENMRLEIEKMKEFLKTSELEASADVGVWVSSDVVQDDRQEEFVVTDVVTFDDDAECMQKNQI